MVAGYRSICLEISLLRPPVAGRCQSSAGGMLPVVYTLLADIILRHQLSWPLVLVGGTALFLKKDFRNVAVDEFAANLSERQCFATVRRQNIRDLRRLFLA